MKPQEVTLQIFTNRKPTQSDGSGIANEVLVFLRDVPAWQLVHWTAVKDGQPWMSLPPEPKREEDRAWEAYLKEHECKLPFSQTSALFKAGYLAAKKVYSA